MTEEKEVKMSFSDLRNMLDYLKGDYDLLLKTHEEDMRSEMRQFLFDMKNCEDAMELHLEHYLGETRKRVEAIDRILEEGIEVIVKSFWHEKEKQNG